MGRLSYQKYVPDKEFPNTHKTSGVVFVNKKGHIYSKEVHEVERTDTVGNRYLSEVKKEELLIKGRREFRLRTIQNLPEEVKTKYFLLIDGRLVYQTGKGKENNDPKFEKKYKVMHQFMGDIYHELRNYLFDQKHQK